MKIGDRVMVTQAIRSRGVATGTGGWTKHEYSGTIERLTKRKVWVRLDKHPQLWPVFSYEVDSVRLIDPPTE